METGSLLTCGATAARPAIKQRVLEVFAPYLVVFNAQVYLFYMDWGRGRPWVARTRRLVPISTALPCHFSHAASGPLWTTMRIRECQLNAGLVSRKDGTHYGDKFGLE